MFQDLENSWVVYGHLGLYNQSNNSCFVREGFIVIKILNILIIF